MESDLFKSNLERWRVFQPKAAALVENTTLATVSTGLNDNGIELNLFKEIDGQRVPLYSKTNISDELQLWGDALGEPPFNTLFVYGIGLGYHYGFMRTWLDKTPRALLVFVEDDLEVIKTFLGTDVATVFLKDPKVRLYHFEPESEDDRFTFNTLGFVSVLEKWQKTGINSYREHKPKLYAEFCGKLDYYCQKVSNIVNEYVQYSLGFQKNFFQNELELPGAYTASRIFEGFKNVPAIICGAGPSLSKNIDLLRQLTDKALIIAGGTAINALNAKNFNPHFGAGIDPNPFHYTRIIANQAFETPFFYRSRIINQALKTVHGDHLYVSGTGGHNVSEWFEQKLGIPEYPLEEGHNVVNMSVSLAKALGCNPIIVVGVDLAYSGNENYAAGIQAHAIHDRKSNFFTKNLDEELITKMDIYGQPVTTLWKWINESVWFGRFAKMHPDITFINATEGGIGFPEIPNMTLEEVADKYLQTSYDFATLIHRNIQRSALPDDINADAIINLMRIVSESLTRCAEIYDQLITGWKEHHVNLLSGQTYEEDFIPPRIEELLKQLQNEDGWKALLKVYNEAFFPILYAKQKELEFNSAFHDSKFVAFARADFFVKSNEFLKTASLMQKYLIEDVIRLYHEENKNIPKQSVSPQTEKLKENLAKDHGSTNEGQGQIKEDKDVQGHVISRSSFLNGKRHGKSWFYFPDKSLKSLQRYSSGQFDGLQEYYYPNGNLKSVLRYQKGLLEGEQLLFHRNGKLYRELHFEQGKRHGTEKLWNAEGIQLLEVRYEQDEPVGTAREWYANGNIAKEIVYHKDPLQNKTRVWDINGVPQNIEKTKKDDYFENLTKQTTLLTSSLDNIYKSIEGVAKNIKIETKPNQTTIQEDIAQMHKDLENLHRINNEMIYESGLDPANKQEQIWKTPSAQRGMENYLRGMTKKMTDDLNSIQNALTIAMGLLADNPTFEKPLDSKEDENDKKPNR
jgi:hypothetical protein